VAAFDDPARPNKQDWQLIKLLSERIGTAWIVLALSVGAILLSGVLAYLATQLL
jgi:hypothetical protein